MTPSSRRNILMSVLILFSCAPAATFLIKRIEAMRHAAEQSSSQSAANQRARDAETAEEPTENAKSIKSLNGAVFESVEQYSGGTETHTFTIQGHQVLFKNDLCCGQGGPNWYGHRGAPGHWILVERAFPIEGKEFVMEGKEFKCRRVGTITASSIVETADGCPDNIPVRVSRRE